MMKVEQKNIYDALSMLETLPCQIDEINDAIGLIIDEYLSCSPSFDNPESYWDLITQHSRYLNLAVMLRRRLDEMAEYSRKYVNEGYEAYFENKKQEDNQVK